MAERGNVVIIGAGPAGSIAGALLSKKGHRVTIVERDAFPRFCIGESLLPQCMEFIAEAGMLEAVREAGFQLKTGAAFLHQDKYSEFCFADKFTPGFDTTFQVQRDRFDALLAEQAQEMGVGIRWRQEVVAADFSTKPVLTIRDENGEQFDLSVDFVLDASGFGRVLPRLLELEKPSAFPFRQALFTHLEDRIDDPGYDRNLIRIIVHPRMHDVWFWLIPFSNGRCSLGVVGKPEIFNQPGLDNETMLQRFVAEEPGLSALLHNAVFDTPVSSLGGYSANVKSLHGNGFALLGNAGEFLDPVFSSGVTIAMKSASLAAAVLDRQFKGEQVDWRSEFAEPLQQGVETFRTFVSAWYDGGFQDIVFYPHLKQAEQKNNIKQMICSILAGYVWDESNPYVKNHRLRLKTLVELCREPGWL
ncbi:NAD(P)/FAD-dependent oxidoreductase [Methylomarinum vadi]|uniref:NAD(P)/FAD-dependent oxidoreductase n=1 Tax=Methylomarinum vadi TaxID=438855 RepID=UPI0004DF5ED9|nr:NAD(P)/FAD-dependent oxidoreductase [Methylomarinum vadi]